jgi:aminopeptidase N
VPASLTRTEARARARAITVDAMEVSLDLRGDERTFASRTDHPVHRCEGSTFVDLRPRAVHALALNGTELDVAALADGRLALTGLVAATSSTSTRRWPTAPTARGCTAASTPPTVRPTSTGSLFLDAAPTVFACFDQPDLKAPYTVRVTAPPTGGSSATAPPRRSAEGEWVLARPRRWRPTSSRSAPGRGCRAGRARRHPPGYPRARSCEPSWSAQAQQIFDRDHGSRSTPTTAVRHPLSVRGLSPGVRAGVQRRRDGEPGLRDDPRHPIFRGAATPTRCSRSNTIAHEMAHMWFGDLVTMRGGTTCGSTSRSPNTSRTG